MHVSRNYIQTRIVSTLFMLHTDRLQTPKYTTCTTQVVEFSICLLFIVHLAISYQCDSTCRPFRMRRISTRRPDAVDMRFHQPFTLIRLPSRARGKWLRMLVRVDSNDQAPPATGPLGVAVNVLRAARCSTDAAGNLVCISICLWSMMCDALIWRYLNALITADRIDMVSNWTELFWFWIQNKSK